jgi:hypothetical protein
MNKQNRILATIAALWIASATAVIVWLTLTRDTRWRGHRGTVGYHSYRIFDWPVLGLWLGIISAVAILAVVLTLVWTEASE